MTGLWRHPGFLRLWAGQTLSVFGSGVTHLALPFAAILYLDASPREVAFLASADVAAGICFALFAGVWADRLRRRPIMIAADTGRAAILASVPVAAWYGALRIEHLYAVAFSAGILTTFFDVAYQSYLPTLIDRTQLVEGNSKLTASASVAEFGSLSLGGWLVQLVTAPGAMALDALTFVISAASLIAIRAPEPAPARDRTRVHHEIAEGIRLLWRDRSLRALAASHVAFSAAVGLISAVLVLFVTRGLGFSPGAQGLIYSVGGLTSFAAAAGAEACRHRFGSGRSMIGGLVASGLGILLIAVAPRAGTIAVILLVAQQIVSDPGWTVYLINQTSLRQAIAPEAVVGRITAAEQFAGLVARLGGSVAAGFIAGAAGPRVVIAAGACSMLAAALVILASPVGRR